MTREKKAEEVVEALRPKANGSVWDLSNGLVSRSPNAGPFKGKIRLLLPSDLEALEDGTVLVCIDGTTVTVGIDKIDTDTRGGQIAYGLPEE